MEAEPFLPSAVRRIRRNSEASDAGAVLWHLRSYDPGSKYGEEIEKNFKALKDELDILPLNTHSEKTTRGFIFIAFLGLIIRSRLMNMMREAEILDKYSVELLLMQLERLRKITLTDGQIFVTEMTKNREKSFRR